MHLQRGGRGRGGRMDGWMEGKNGGGGGQCNTRGGVDWTKTTQCHKSKRERESESERKCSGYKR